MNVNMSSLREATTNAFTNMSSVTSLRSMLSMPSRLYNHIRGFDDYLAVDIQPQNGHGQYSGPSHSSQFQRHDILVNLPGPWAFLTSGYAVSLLGMALILNRIQHIVVPPRHSLVQRLARQYTHSRTRSSLFRLVLSIFFPLNLSSTLVRLVLRAPSIYLLWRSLAVFCIVLLQTSDLLPAATWFTTAAEWGARMEMKEVCWDTFTSVCLALAVDALIRGLEGRSTSGSSPFNLFGYAFLLHIYSSPITHQIKHGDRGPTRPDKHIIVTIIIPLLQLALLHTLSVRRKWASQRLIPTTVCGLLTLTHFHFVLFFSPTPYPLINYLPSVLESVLLAIIILTVSLHVLTQLLLEGTITRPLLGHTRTLAPRWDEDFAVALLRVGTASLEATSAAGLGNEVIGIGAGSSRGKEAEVELGRAQLLSMRNIPGGRGKIGFENEVKRIKAVTANDGDGWIDMVWLREWMRFLDGVWALLKGSWRMLRRAMCKRLGMGVGDDIGIQPVREEPLRQPLQRQNMNQDEDLYQRFLRGEAVSDDESDFVDDDSGGEVRTRSPSDTEPDTEDDFEGREAAALYADLSSSAFRRAQSSTPPPLAPVLLAHVTSHSPLTRRQYSRLLARPEDGWADFVDERRSGRVGGISEVEDDSRRNCVVCTVEAREVICWPCRCLALCDDCRANLASRFPASKHTCPCCRRNVEGYSRIYIP